MVYPYQYNMIALFLLAGLFATVIGALPLGASNIAVINTTLKENIPQALKIATTAALAEVLLSFYALYYNMAVKEFLETNQWLQIVIAALLLIIGVLLFFKSKRKKDFKDTNSRFKNSKYLTGFVLGLFNPPVLVYWIVAFGILNSNELMLSINSPIPALLLFFLGVYLGKLGTLYMFSKFSVVIKERFSNVSLVVNKLTGSLLFTVGLFQFAKLYFI